MKNLKLLFFLLTFSFCSQSGEITMGISEPYFAGTEDMAFSENTITRDGSFSQGDYIIKTAYASTDVSSSNFESTINEVEVLVKNYSGNISNTYLSTNYQGLKSYNVTMNIPAEEFENFLSEVEEISKFTNINLNANDVTKYVLDIDSRLKSLKDEKKALECLDLCTEVEIVLGVYLMLTLLLLLFLQALSFHLLRISILNQYQAHI